MKGPSLIILTVTCALQVSAQVINYEIDPTFDSQQLFFRGSVSDILHTSNDQFLIMGMFGGTSLSSGLLSNDGNLVYPNVVGGQKVAEYLNGYLSYGSGIKHVELGAGLTAFSFEFLKPAYSGPLSTQAYDVMVMPDDNILVAGRFFTDSTLMGTAEIHLGLRQLCMIDSTGAPVPEFPMIRCAEPVSAYISSVRKLSTGEYIVSGTFDEIEGHYSPKIAKLNPDFSVNTDFISPFLPGGGVVGVSCIDSQDRVWIGFTSSVTWVNPPSSSDPPQRNARLLSTGEVDSSFNVPILTTYYGPDPSNPTEPAPAGAIVLEDIDGTFILGGSFIEVNGESHNRLVKIDEDGTVIEGAFGDLGPDEAFWGTWTPPIGPIVGAYVSVLRKLPDGKLLIGGQFSSFGGEPYSCLVRLMPQTVGTDDREGRGALRVYPNPARNHFRIEMPEGAQHLESVQLWDVQGRAVRAWLAGHGQFDIEGLPAGMYVVRAMGKDGIYTQKLIVQ